MTRLVDLEFTARGKLPLQIGQKYLMISSSGQMLVGSFTGLTEMGPKYFIELDGPLGGSMGVSYVETVRRLVDE